MFLSSAYKCHGIQIAVNDVSIYSPNWIKTRGEEYHRGECVLIGKQCDDDLPIFSKIIDLMNIVDYAVIEVNVCRTNGLANHLMSYRVENSLHSCCVSLLSLPDSHPHTAHTFDDGNLFDLMWKLNS